MILYSGVFLSGFILLLFEILGIRILTPDFGGHILTVSGVIGVFLLALSIGYELGGRLADRYPHASFFALLFLISGAVLLFFTHFARSLSHWIAEYEIGKVFAPYFAAFFIFTIPAAMMAMISPVAIRLNSSVLEQVGSTSGRIFAVSTVGSIFGALSSPFLIHYFQIRPVLYTASALLIAYGVLVYFFSFKKLWHNIKGEGR
ncbi:MAG: fused MFS/spermidine synthase [bacterium JZ-2024 1]